jgi:hypothetical protein
MHMGFDSSQRSVLEGDGEGCCCWRRFIDLLVSELYTNVGLGVLLDPVVDDEAMEDASSIMAFDVIECLIDSSTPDFRRRGLNDGVSLNATTVSRKQEQNICSLVKYDVFYERKVSDGFILPMTTYRHPRL